MSYTDTVDVIIPAYNAGKTVAATIRSVLAQTYPLQSIYIVNDASSDNTVEVVQSFNDPRIKILHHAVNKGVCAARNTGLRAAKSEMIGFVDADDQWHPNKIALQVGCFHTTNVKDCGVVYCGYNQIDDQGNHLPLMHKLRARGYIYNELLYGNLIIGSASASLVKKSYADQVGAWDETLVHGEDWDYWLRMSRICGVDFVPDPLITVMTHAGSRQNYYSGTDKARIWRDHLKVLAKCEQNSPVPRNVYAPYYRSILHHAIKENHEYNLKKILSKYQPINPKFANIGPIQILHIYIETALKFIKELLF